MREIGNYFWKALDLILEGRLWVIGMDISQSITSIQQVVSKPTVNNQARSSYPPNQYVLTLTPIETANFFVTFLKYHFMHFIYGFKY